MRLITQAALTATAFLFAAAAQAAPVNLNDFFADPTVTVSADGSMATLAEDDFFAVVILSNDPGFGEPNVILPELGPLLRFEYEFSEPLDQNNDEFAAFIIDATTGGSIGGMWEFSTQEPGSGTITFDLAPLLGQTLGLEFQLRAILPSDVGLTSTVKISDVRLEEAGNGGVPDIPEPGTLWLVIGSLAGLYLRRSS